MAYNNYDDDMLNFAVETWHSFLSELDARLVFGIVDKIAATRKKEYPPVISQILEEYQKAINPSAFVSGEEAWGTVRKAILKFGYYRESEALASLSAASAKAVKSIGFQNLCKADDKQFDFMRKNFIEAYKQVEYDERHELINPEGHKRLSDIIKKMPLPKNADKFLDGSE